MAKNLDPRAVALALCALITALALLFPKPDEIPPDPPAPLPPAAGTPYSSPTPATLGCLRERDGSLTILPGCRYLGVADGDRYHLYLAWETGLPGPLTVQSASIELLENQQDAYAGPLRLVAPAALEGLTPTALDALPTLATGDRISPRALRIGGSGLDQHLSTQHDQAAATGILVLMATDPAPSSVDEYTAELKLGWRPRP